MFPSRPFKDWFPRLERPYKACILVILPVFLQSEELGTLPREECQRTLLQCHAVPEDLQPGAVALRAWTPKCPQGPNTPNCSVTVLLEAFSNIVSQPVAPIV